MVPNTTQVESILLSFRTQLQGPFFMEIIVTTCWAIWTMCNDAIFNNLSPSVHSCKQVFKEFALVILRAKSKFHPSIDSWLEVFV
jgi:hypothetical protein